MSAAARSVLTYLITPGEATVSTFQGSRDRILRTVELAVGAGIDFIQIREKYITTKRLFELSRSVVEIAKGSQTRVLINGRADVARAAGAVGVQLPENGVPVGAVRKTFGSDFLIGASVHSVDVALDAREKGADLVLFGPVFDSPGKSGQGIETLRDVCVALDGFPAIAVGGIDASNVNSVIESGAAGFAAIRFLNDEDTLAAMRARLGSEVTFGSEK